MSPALFPRTRTIVDSSWLVPSMRMAGDRPAQRTRLLGSVAASGYPLPRRGALIETRSTGDEAERDNRRWTRHRARYGCKRTAGGGGRGERLDSLGEGGAAMMAETARPRMSQNTRQQAPTAAVAAAAAAAAATSTGRRVAESPAQTSSRSDDTSKRGGGATVAGLKGAERGKRRSRKTGNGDLDGTGDGGGDGDDDRHFSRYLSIVEPFPVEPPPYFTTLPRMARPAFSDFESKNEALPGYVPTVYKLGILYKKAEWNSPFEMASQRQWRPYIVELNSTQLNFYRCPFRDGDPIMKKFDASSSFSSSNSHSLLHPYHHHHLYLKREQGCKAPSAVDPTASYSYNEDNYRSVMTTKTDLRALKFFKSIGALESTKIVRSFTLQYGRIGLAIDYKKKSDVFRGRFETEQFLLKFPSTEAMVEWYNALNLGIDTALDVSRREMPTYRTVPRRRRRRHRNHYRSLNVAMGITLGAHHVLNPDQHTRRGSTSSAPSHGSSKDNTENYRNKDKSENSSLMKFFKKRSGSSAGSSTNEGLVGMFRKKRTFKSVPDASATSNSSNINHHKSAESADDQNIVMLTNNMASSHIDTDYSVDEGLDGEDYEGSDDDELVDDDEDEYEISVHLDDENDEHDSDTASDNDDDSNSNGATGNTGINNGNAFNNLGNCHEAKGVHELQKPNESTPGIRNRSSESSRSTGSLHSTTNKINTANTTPQSMLTPIQSSTGESLPKSCKLRTYREYIAKPSPHSINTHTFPAQRKILRDSIRCMVPLVENERWTGRYVLLDVGKSYRPQGRDAVDRHFQSLEVLTHVGSVGGNYTHKFQRPLQEWIVTPSGLIPHINPSYNR